MAVPPKREPWLLDSIEGSVYAIGETSQVAADRPGWARALHWAAVAVAFLVAATVALSWRIGRLLFGRRGRRPNNVSLPALFRRLAGGADSRGNSVVGAVLGAFLGARLGAHHPTPIQLWRVDTADGAYAVRVPISPAHPFDVRVGDIVRCWGRLGGDGTMHAHRVFDSRTGKDVRITLVRREAVAVVAAAGVFALLTLTHL